MTAGQLPGRAPTCRPELATVNDMPDRLTRVRDERLYEYGASRLSLRSMINPPDDDDEEGPVASWITEGTAHRSPVCRDPVRHLLVHGHGWGEWALWCSSGKGRKDYNPHSRKFCRDCKRLAQDAIDAGDLAASDVRGWPVTNPPDDDEKETGR